MNTFVAAIIPIIILIIIGYVLRRSKFVPDSTWPGIEKLTYYVLFPSLLIKLLGGQTFIGTPWPSILTVVVGTIMSSAVLLIFFGRVFFKNNATFTSVFQGGVRFNTYITLAIVQNLYGSNGLEMGAIAVGFMILLINFLCVSAFLIWGKNSTKGVLAMTKEIIFNPLIISCVIGLFLSLSEIGLPYFSGDILEIIGRAALPFGLLAVGAALRPEKIRGHLSPIVFSSIAQFCVKPIVASLLLLYTGLTGTAAAVLTIAFMTPTAPSAYILSRQLGGDSETMASIISFQTLFAFIIMPLLGSQLL